MTTPITLSEFKYVFKGTYAGGTAYVVNDLVVYLGSSYICISPSTGNVPTSQIYWAPYALKAVDGAVGDLLAISGTVQGDIYYNAGGTIARLAPGTSGQFLRTNGAAANPSWATADTKQAQYTDYSTRTTQGYSANTPTNITGLSVSITPSTNTAKILLFANVHGEFGSGQSEWDSTFGFNRGGTYLPQTDGVVQYSNVSYGNYITCSTYGANSNNDSTPDGASYWYVDTPATTSAVTYYATYRPGGGSGSYCINRCYNNSAETFVSTIYAIEIG